MKTSSKNIISFFILIVLFSTFSLLKAQTTLSEADRRAIILQVKN